MDQGVAQKFREFGHHATGAGTVLVDHGSQGIKGIEEEVRVQLVRQHLVTEA